jgi:hypothetical protein
VPADVAVFIPIAGSECSTLEPPPFHGANEEELAACAAGEADRYTGVVVRVNGEVVPEIERYRAQSPPFTLQLPEDNILAVPPGTGRAVADGYQVILPPLAPGAHEIVVHVEVTEGYALPDKTLRLTVVEPPAELEPLEERFVLLLVNAGHGKAVSGRKTGVRAATGWRSCCGTGC